MKYPVAPYELTNLDLLQNRWQWWKRLSEDERLSIEERLEIARAAARLMTEENLRKAWLA